MKPTFLHTAILAGAMAFALISPARAEYPEKPITMLVPTKPGGGMDTTARLLAPHMEKALGATIVIVNKPEGGGLLALTDLARAKPDGYAIAIATLPWLVTAAITTSDARFKASDVSYIGSINTDPMVIAVLADSPIKSIDDLLAGLKDKSSNTTLATPPLRSDQSMAMTLFGVEAGVPFDKVPFDSGGAIINALLGGHVSAACLSLGGMARVGDKVRILAQSGAERDSRAPDVPTFKELGYDVTVSVYRSIIAPAGLPDDVSTKLQEAFMAALGNEQLQAEAAEKKLPIMPIGGAALAELAGSMDTRLSKLWKETPWFEAN